MKNVQSRHIQILKKSLTPIPRELDGLDWKIDITPEKKQLARHLSAFANRTGGGFLVFGVRDDGEFVGVTQEQVRIILEKIGNISRDGLEPSVGVRHEIEESSGVNLLFVEIIESQQKPVHLKGKPITESFVRSTGTTRKASNQDMQNLLISSKTPIFEQRIALANQVPEKIKELLFIREYFNLLNKPIPSTLKLCLTEMERDRLLISNDANYDITNLGAILFARDLSSFSTLATKGTRIIVYSESGKSTAIKDKQAKLGYALGLPRLLNYLMDLLPVNEVVNKAIRSEVKMYPEGAMRELLANALIHQDLESVGTQPRVEIFADRLEISNPGRPLIEPLRMIDGCQSRNERLASFMNRLGFCEERGKGIDEVIREIELYQLPPPEFTQSETHTKVTLFSQRNLTQMIKKDRVRACFQHCTLRYVFHKPTNNQSVRERFGISDANKSQASRIIKDTIQSGLIVQEDPTNVTKKFSSYVPYWAVE